MANNVFKVDNGLTVSGGDLRVVNANAVELRANTTIAADASVSANLTVSGNTHSPELQSVETFYQLQMVGL